jgi:CBS domain-containing protein
MKVQQLMTSEVQTCHPDDALHSAAEKLWTHDIGCLPVVDHDGRLCGMITDRDICMAAYTQGRSLSEIPISTAMSKEVYACTTNDNINAAEEAMRSHQVRRLPVVNDSGELVGIVSLNDIAREAERELGLKSREISTQEVTATLATVSQPRQHDGPVVR